MEMTLSSPAFNEGGEIPPRYTCQGENASPRLGWDSVPEGTKSLALVMDDPDAPSGVFTHWVIFNLPPGTPGLAEAIPALSQLPDGALQGKNDFGRFGYGGPCPPPGRPHHYLFTLYALDKTLGLQAGASKEQVLKAAGGNTLAHCRLTGTYRR